MNGNRAFQDGGGTARRTFLGVERSVLRRRWEPAMDARAEAAALRMAQDTTIPEIVCRVLAGSWGHERYVREARSHLNAVGDPLGRDS